MNNSVPVADPTLGLCGHCRLARYIKSEMGAQYVLCTLSQSDANYPKYPRLPKLVCPGYKSDMGAAVANDSID